MQTMNYTNKITEFEPNSAQCDNKFGKNQIVFNETTAVVKTNSGSSIVSFNGGSAEDLKASMSSIISENGTVFTCTVCGKTKDNKIDKRARRQIERHVESMHLEGVTYDCGRCDQTFRSRNALDIHTYSKHK